LFLLGATVVNALSFDTSGAANALGWIFMSFVILWAFLAAFTRARWVNLLFDTRECTNGCAVAVADGTDYVSHHHCRLVDCL
jgi:hypothetical protein